MADFNHFGGGAAGREQLPDFLRFNRYGGVLSARERERVAKTRGVCATCGRVTHKVSPFRTTPLDNDKVRNGVCLFCYPDQRGPSGGQSSSAPSITGSMTSARGSGASSFNSSLSILASRSDAGETHQSFISKPSGSSSLRSGVIRSRFGPSSSQNSNNSNHKHDSGSSNSATAASKEGSSQGQLSPSPSSEQAPQPHSASSSDARPATSSAKQAVDMGASESDIWDVLKDMRSHPEDTDILTRKCHELRSIGTNQAGSLYEVIEIMRRFPRISSLQFAACGALWGISADGGDDRKTEAIEAGAAKSIIDAMKHIPGDANLVQWGCGTLSSFAEGMGGRADLFEYGVVQGIESVLQNHFHAPGVLYWVFRTLTTLVYVYGEAECVNEQDDVEEDLDAVRQYITAISEANIVHSVLKAMTTVPMDSITLEWGFKFLAHFPLSKYIEAERDQLVEACLTAIRSGSHSKFPTLEKLACAILCTIMSDTSSMTPYMQESPDWVSGCMTALLKSLSANIENDPISLDVTICTFSHILSFRTAAAGSTTCEKVIKTCISIMEKQRSSLFLQETSCWIMWVMFSEGAIQNIDLTTKAYVAIKKSMMENPAHSGLLTMGMGALANAALLVDLVPEPLTELIFTSTNTHFDNNQLREQACRLLSNVCKTKSAASYILSNGGLSLIDDALTKASPQQRREAVNLMYILSILSDDAFFSLDNLEAMLELRRECTGDIFVAAKSLYLLTTLGDRGNGEFTKLASLAVESIQNVMEEFPTNKNLQKYACLALRNLATMVQLSRISLDPSAIIKHVLKAQNDHGAQIHKESCDALWALTGIDFEMGPKVIVNLADSIINVMTSNIGSSGSSFRGDILTSAVAVLFNITSDPISAVLSLGGNTLERIIDLVNSIIYACLDKYGNHPGIFSFGFGVLCHLCEDRACRGVVVRYGGIVAVIDGMMANTDIAAIQERGCKVLGRLAEHDLEIKLCVVESDGVDVIISGMMAHTELANLQAEACHVLSTLSVDADSRTFIAQQGGIMLIANAVRAHSENIPLQVKGLSALCSLASDAGEDILEMSNTVAVVLGSLNRHPEIVSIQEKGLAVLQNLSMRNQPFKDKIIAAGCLGVVMKAMQNHPNSLKVVEYSLSMLWNLIQSNRCLQILCEEGGVELAINVMMVNIQVLKIQMLGCSVICSLSNAEQSRNVVRKNKGVEALIYSMIVHFSSEYVQDTCCRALSCFVLDSVSNTNTPIAAVSIIEAILSAMAHFPGSNKVQEHAILALRNMSLNPENSKAILQQSNSLQEALKAAMLYHPETCKERARTVLDNVNMLQ